MAHRVAGALRQWVRDPEIMTTLVAILRPATSVLPGLGPDLACALRFRALGLAAAGWYDDALIDVEEALRICRRPTTVRRTTTEVQYAAALNLRANVLRCSGREREAVADARQALALCRGRMPHAPRRFGPVLLTALDELARSLDKAGEPGQALPFGEELVRILRHLAPRRPRYNSFLAAALHQLGSYISEVGELTDALRATEESLELYRRLDYEQPESFALHVELATYNRTLFLDRLKQQG
ncbi:tetratricopeptide repeat protein [Nocardia panacis]|uniref:Tetratricopeptide repeat protein n=1 Tax=Nocardia panacis TaxID=2340916 RepID=A0A3A4KI62_9NOCA|nr:tetratricopeptide repeat protein [Nocardia panacis]RJO73383.1 tetratricopeptide repeat protein [Nocardia panacis]